MAPRFVASLLLLASALLPSSATMAAERLEPGFLPAINYDSNLGFGFGVIGNIAKLSDTAAPYVWRVQAQAFASAKGAPGGGVEIPFQEHYLIADIPRLWSPRLRMRFTARFEKQINTGYFGIGNGSVEADPEAGLEPDSEAFIAASRFHQYERVRPGAGVDARVQLVGELEAFGRASVIWSFFELYPGSRLALDTADPGLAGLLIGSRRHGTFEGTLGLLRDTRDNEITPSSGGFHEVSLRAGRLVEVDGVYGGFNATTRYFHTLVDDRLVVAARLLGDVLVGDAPFYELARFGGLNPRDGIAGSTAIRGPPGQRYHGKVKLIGNVELRSRLLDFSMFGLPSNFGAVAFADAGRVWTALANRPDLDGTGLGLKYGLGGGLRVQWGETFIVRADSGWSPDGLSIFININHVF